MGPMIKKEKGTSIINKNLNGTVIDVIKNNINKIQLATDIIMKYQLKRKLELKKNRISNFNKRRMKTENLVNKYTKIVYFVIRRFSNSTRIRIARMYGNQLKCISNCTRTNEQIKNQIVQSKSEEYVIVRRNNNTIKLRKAKAFRINQET